jgi:hypothetical protein
MSPRAELARVSLPSLPKATIPATCTWAWVSTPPVTSRPASAIVGMSSPFLAGTGMAPRGTGRTDRELLGQQRWGSYQVTAVPAPRVPHPPAGPRPAVREQDTPYAISHVQGQAGGPAAERAKPHRTGCGSPADIPARSNPQPHRTILRKCCVPVIVSSRSQQARYAGW